MMERWFWQRRAYRLAGILVRLGAARRRGLWLAVHRLSPRLAGLCLLYEDSARPENTLYWAWEPGDDQQEEGTVEAVLAEVSAMVDRAPVPLGGDDYLIFVRQYLALPGEEQGVPLADLDRLDETIPLRERGYAGNLRGNRWSDWKHGEGPAALRRALVRAEPAAKAPLTLICVVIAGRAAGRAFLCFNGQQPAF